MPRERTRSLRVAAEIQRILSELLLTEIKDPRLERVRVSEVELSGDLGVATVFFSTLDLEDDPLDAIEAFTKARGFIRSQVGQALGLRRIPEFRFRHDTSARRGVELSRLIAGTPRPAPKPDDQPD
jgi:ribosome-binding factor A